MKQWHRSAGRQRDRDRNRADPAMATAMGSTKIICGFGSSCA